MPEKPPRLAVVIGLEAFAFRLILWSIVGLTMVLNVLSAQEIIVLDRGYNYSLIGFAGDRGDGTEPSCRWVQLEDGLNYWDPEANQWAESSEAIELVPGAAVARHGQHRAIFSANVNDSEGALDLDIRHGVRLRSSVLALGYFEPATGQAIVLARIHDTQGEWIPPNQVVYRDAFDALKADVLYTYRKRGVEADVILREVPPSPSRFSIAPEVARFEVYTEFFDPPEPAKRSRILSRLDDPVLRTQVAEPDWIDEELDFGVSSIGQGRAFAWSARDAAQEDPDRFAPVGKHWLQTQDGRTFLVESAEYVGIMDDLLVLGGAPENVQDLRDDHRRWVAGASNSRKTAVVGSLLHKSPNQGRDWPPIRNTSAASRRLPSMNMTIARTQRPLTPGVVLDWSTVSAGSTNFTFQSDTTYYVTGNCFFYGTTRLEGGAVIKFQRHTNVWSGIAICGQFDSRTSLYLPAVFTAEDDNTVGESILAGTPSPSAYYASLPLRFDDVGVPVRVENVRVKHQYRGIAFQGNCPNNLVRNCQIVDCLESIRNVSTGPVRVQNLLINGVRSGGYAFYGESNCVFSGENLTIAKAPNLRTANCSLALTNCLLVEIGTLQSYSGQSNVVAGSAADLFNSVGAGGCYLPGLSPHRNAGSTAIDSSLLVLLRSLTTQGPQILATDFTIDTLLEPCVLRDTDTPDLGYHYPPIDYCINGLGVNDCLLTVTNGAAIAFYGSTGFVLRPGGHLASGGAPGRPNRFLPYNCVQEATTNWGGAADALTMVELASEGTSGEAIPAILTRFSEFLHLGISPSAPNGFHKFVATDWSKPVMPMYVRDCRFANLYVGASVCSTNQEVQIVNNLFERCFSSFYSASVSSPNNLELYNNLFVGGFLALTGTNASSFIAHDNLVAPLALTATAPLVASHNGFAFGLTAFGTSPTTGLSTDFVRGPLGDYYYPTLGGAGSLASLQNAGSRGADEAGLFHYTTLADQRAETNSIVDIGFHYAAVGAGFTDLIGHWSLDENSGVTVSDLSTNQLLGTALNGPTWVPGTTGSALAFDGANDQVSVTDTAVLRPTSGFTIAFWAKKNSENSDYVRYVGKGSGTNRNFGVWDIVGSSGRVMLQFNNSSGAYESFGSVRDIPAGRWFHAAATWDGATGRIYLDGQLDRELALTGPPRTSTDPLTFGFAGFNGPLDGCLDDIWIYGRALNSSEIASVYQSTPRDTDGDGLADYAEDLDNDGIVDEGETDWRVSNNGMAGPVGLNVFTPLK